MHEIPKTATLVQAAVPPAGLYRNLVKRAVDLLAVLLVAPVVVPVVLVLAALVSLDGGRPFYSQQRIGRDGRLYRMWKLRTMVPDAEAVLAAYCAADPSIKAEWDLMQKLEVDPRVTRLGHLLRKSSLDELPQFWNVFVGDMSLVGPRPMMPDQWPLYPGSAYLRLRPGITGPWQISDRNRSTFAERAVFDEVYDRRLSLRGDLGILLATVRVVVACTGR